MIYFLLGSNLSLMEAVAFILAYMIALTLAFCVHEFSHAYVAYKVGDPTAKLSGRISLNPAKHIDPVGLLCFLVIGFGWAKPVQINPMYFKNYKRGMAFVSLAGVTANIILAFVFSGIYFFAFPYLNSTNMLIIFITYLLEYTIIVNLALFIFNLLPIFPLDGFSFLTAFLKPTNAFLTFMRQYGSIILLLFLITPLFDIVYSFLTTHVLTAFFDFWRLFT